MSTRQKILRLLIVLLLTGLFFITLFCYNNFNMLTIITNGFDQPSTSYYFCQQKLLRLLDSTKNKEIVEILRNDEKKYLQDIYLRLISLKGLQKDNTSFVTIYNNYKARDDHSICNVIDAIGTSGNLGYLPFLEKLLDEYGAGDSVLMRFSIGQALFLLTGMEYKYDHSKPYENSRFAPKGFFRHTDRQLRARKIIYDTINRERTIDEMIEIDQLLFRPPGW